MQSTLENFFSGDGRALQCHHWYPPAAVKARVGLLHGIESHPRWFEGTCQWLADRGYHVAALRRRGSGTDGQERGDIPAYRNWIDDVECVAKRLRGERPQVKIHLAGISWGGKLACACAVHSSPWISSLILISPGLVPRVGLPLCTRLRVAWNYFFHPTKRFELPLGRAEMFTASKHWKEFIDGDSLRLREVTARFLGENVKLDSFLRRNCNTIGIPVLMLLAHTDEIIDTGKTKQYVARFGSERKRIVEYPGTVHTLEFEDNPDVWRKDVLAWLDSF